MSVLIPPNGKSVLLDTTIVVDHFRLHNTHLDSFLQAGGLAYLPLTVLGELFAGAARVVRRDRAIQQIQLVLTTAILLLPGDATAQTYGEIHGEMAKAGTPIPQNDIWIAAMAREHQLPLVTRDSHFQKINGLIVLNWS